MSNNHTENELSNNEMSSQEAKDEDLNTGDPRPESEDDGDEETDIDEDDDEEDEDDDETEVESESDNENQENEDSIDLKPPLSPNSIPTCYICLNEFEGQDIGSPDSCENFHSFCLECIEEWSKQINTCPVDRKSFSYILVRREINGEIIMKVPITKNSVVEIETISDDVTYCEICGRCDREDRLLLCDGCDFGYHCECLDPPLDTIPVDEWFCSDCFERLFGDDVRQESFRRQSTSRRRAIARTGAFEIVRNRILARRTVNQTNTTTSTRTTKKKKKTRKTKRKTKKTSKSNKKSKKRKTKKRTKKSKMSTWRLPSASTRYRIATKLGLGCKPKSPFGLPTMRSLSNNRSISEIRHSAGISNLSMFGYELEFNNVRSYDDLEYENDFGDVGILSAARHHVLPTISKAIKSPESFPSMSSTDLLSDIMSSQEVLHATKSDLSIARNGRVYLNTACGSARKCPDYNSQSSSSNISNSESSNSNGNTTSSAAGYLKSYGNNSENVNENDISLVKPTPVVALQDDKPDVEFYSDIESVGDKDCEDSEKKEKKKEPENETNDNEVFSVKTDVNSDDSITNEKPCKRRPSIMDLFGGDSDEEVDDDLKRLVAQKGSINVHYPIKMPIVLKTNILSGSKKSSQDDEVPISKKWVPIYPEPDKAKSSGPKWKAIGDEKSESKKEADNDNTKVEYTSRLVKECPSGTSSKAVDVDKSSRKAITLDKEKCDSLSKSKQSQSTSRDKSETLAVVVEAEAQEMKRKIRVCKHGKVLNKDKHSDKKRPLESESQAKKPKLNEEKPKSASEKPNEDDSESNVNWKKLSTTSKMRSYRDGKTNKNEDLLFADRHLKESASSRRHSSKSESKAGKRDDSRCHHRKHDEDRSYKSSRRKSESDSSKVRHHGESSKHRDPENKSSKEASSKSSHHHHHRHSKSKHKSHHEPSKEKATTSSTYQSYPVIKTLDSKKIYAEGDKILINVNFKSEDVQLTSKRSIEVKKGKESSSSSSGGDKPVKNGKNVEISSPQSSDYNTNKSDITSPNSEDYTTTTVAGSTDSKKKTLPSAESLQTVLSEEFKFLPKLLPNKESTTLSSSILNQSSPEDYLNDSIPTPTQDESNSPLRNCQPNKVDSIKSSPVEQKDDLYDPELPLESPDHNSITSPPKDKISIGSVSSPKSSPTFKRKSATSQDPQPLSSTVASATATLASLNSFNLARLIQIAQSIKNPDSMANSTNGNVNSKLSQSSKHSSQQKHATDSANRDIIEIVDMDVDSPSPTEQKNYSSSLSNVKEIWDQIMKSASSRLSHSTAQQSDSKKLPSRFDFLDEQPTSAVDMEIKEKYIKKLNRQERVVEEVKLALKPHYQKKRITKEEYKDILRKAVPKVCHSKTGEINPSKIQKLVDAYIKRIRYVKKKSSV